jgi:membrane protease YdiL (CAAX protease family)
VAVIRVSRSHQCSRNLVFVHHSVGCVTAFEERLKEVIGNRLRKQRKRMILVGLAFGLLYLGLYYLISLLLGSRFEFGSFPNLRGFEGYAVYSLPLAFGLYLLFSVFGAFEEEVAYRGYVQTRIASRYGSTVGISFPLCSFLSSIFTFFR